MRFLHLAAFSLFAFLLMPALAQKASPAEDAGIRSMLERQTDDWNRGDIDAFAKGYKNSPDILFIGSTISRGYQGMLERYHKGYPNKAAMGVLTFSNLEVHPLDARFATVIGNFHLERGAAGGGNADGYYSLVVEKTAEGWKIVLDHTTATAPKIAAGQ
jgi:ketosteroid isomerase-like protein